MANRSLDITTIGTVLGAHQPEVLEVDRGHASVAMILRQVDTTPEVLFIIRASHDGDPWSGDIGFPGGRIDPTDHGAKDAAEREVFEELGYRLKASDCLGRLDDLYGATLPILVSCYVYLVDKEIELIPNHEVSEIFWFPLGELLDPKRHHKATLTYRGRTISHPAVDLLGPDETVLWGITYRILRHFFALMGHDFGDTPVIVDARP